MTESSEHNLTTVQPTALPPASPNADYNPIFERLVIEPTDGEVLGVIAYGAYKKAKWEWAQEVFRKEGRPPTDAERKAYIATWTPRNWITCATTLHRSFPPMPTRSLMRPEPGSSRRR